MQNVSDRYELEVRRYANAHGLSVQAAREKMREEQMATLMARFDEAIADAEQNPRGESPIDIARRVAEQEAWFTKVRAAGIEERYFDATLSGWSPSEPDQQRVRQGLVDWVAMIGQPGCPSRVLQGAKGVGKTHLACGILLDRLRAGKDGMFTLAKAYTGLIRESYRKDSHEPESAILARYSGVGLLVIDDAGRQFDTEAEKLYLFDLINERYNKGKPTLFTTNMAVTHPDPAVTPEFQAYVGEAIMDRLRQGGGKFVQMNWASRRV
jgi:DNA replication protein DnaC